MSINADWEKFLAGPNRSPRTSPNITISERAHIQFNTFTFEMLGKPEAVELFFNRREQKIGMKAASPRFRESFPVKVIKPGASTRIVNAAAFCKHYRIAITETHKFLHLELVGDRMLVLNLNDTIIVSRIRGRKKA